MAKQIKHTDRPYPFNLLEAMHELNPMIPVDLENLPSDFKGSINYILTEKLTDRERGIFKFRFQHRLTLKQISESLGVCTERVRQCEERALRKLACSIHANYIIHGVKKMTAGDYYFSFKPKDLFKNDGTYVNIAEDGFIKKTIQQYGFLDEIPIENLGLSTYIVNQLIKAGISSSGDLMEKESAEEIKKIKGIGNKCTIYILKAIAILESEKRDRENSGVKGIPIVELDLSIRSYNALMRYGVRKLGDIWDWEEEDYYKVKNMGKKCVDEMMKIVSFYKEKEMEADQC